MNIMDNRYTLTRAGELSDEADRHTKENSSKP